MVWNTKNMRDRANEISAIGAKCQNHIDRMWEIFSIEIPENGEWIGPTYDAAKEKFSSYKTEMDNLANVINRTIPNGIIEAANNYDKAEKTILNNI